MREIKFEILWVCNNKDFTKSIKTHYTTLDRITDGRDKFDYSMVDIVAKRQWTGLQDKNGKDIYEGDIVEYIRHISSPSDYHTGEPLFPDGEYKRVGHVTITTSRGVVINGYQDFEPDTIDDGQKTRRKYKENPSCWNQYAEVIGNIHQNPELLKEIN